MLVRGAGNNVSEFPSLVPCIGESAVRRVNNSVSPQSCCQYKSAIDMLVRHSEAISDDDESGFWLSATVDQHADRFQWIFRLLQALLAVPQALDEARRVAFFVSTEPARRMVDR